MSDEELFIGYEVSTGVIPAFFIESTAPVNVDDRDGKALPSPDGCARLPSVEDAVEKIAMKLLEQKEPKLVITVHGFNSPRESVLKYYTNSFLAVDGDDAIRDRGVVCMGYRWPSEHMGTPWRSGLSAAPLFLVGVLLVALVVFWYVNFWIELCSIPRFFRILITAVHGDRANRAVSATRDRLFPGWLSRDQLRCSGSCGPHSSYRWTT
jgi:hypothetical protein